MTFKYLKSSGLLSHSFKLCLHVINDKNILFILIRKEDDGAGAGRGGGGERWGGSRERGRTRGGEEACRGWPFGPNRKSQCFFKLFLACETWCC